MVDIPFGYLCEVDHVEKLEDGIHHRIWLQTLCPKKTHYGLHIMEGQSCSQTRLQVPAYISTCFPRERSRGSGHRQ